VLVIDPSPVSIFASLRQVWAQRELLFYLVLRDIIIRYKQTMLGVAWAVIQPLSMMLVFTLFFRRVAGGGPADIPYSVFVFTGLLPWMFFATALSAAGQSVLSAQNLVTKVYFPRLILPLTPVGAGLVDLAIGSIVLLPLMAYHGIMPGRSLWLLPFTVLGLSATALGVGAILTALVITYRDFRFVIPFLVQLWLFTTPAVYMQSDPAFVSPRWKVLLALNPAQGLIRNFRAAILGLPPDFAALAVSLVIGLALFLVGCTFFNSRERMFADVV
jgi:lipopolysaccharide transport system permease protein